MSHISQKELFYSILEAILNIIKRRSSEHYAAVILSGVIKALSKKHKTLKHVVINSSLYSETSKLIEVHDTINKISPKEFKDITDDILRQIVTSIGRTAGYFFLKELKDNLGIKKIEALESLGVDIGSLQVEKLIEKKTEKIAPELTSHLNYILYALFSYLESQVSIEFAITTLTTGIKILTDKYKFLNTITINDIRYTQADEIITISPEINSVEPSLVRLAIQDLLTHINKALESKDKNLWLHDFKNKLRSEEQSAFEAIGVNLNTVRLSHEAVYKYMMKTLINLLSKNMSVYNTMIMFDNILKKIDKEYPLINYVTIDPKRYTEGFDAVKINRDIDNVNPLLAGQFLQKIVEEVINAVNKNTAITLIETLKKNIEQPYLIRMDELGVNFYIIQLKQELTTSPKDDAAP
ncbi:MAG: hypothetical protein QXS02_01590 [Candidatus Thermoplasmatota archaeon]